MSAIEHPSDKTLSALWREDLPAADTESILAHVESCVECGQRLETIDPSIQQYRRFVALIDPHLPAPQRGWTDIWTEMERVDQLKRPVAIEAWKRPRRRPIWIAAIAAAILLGFLTWPRGVPVARAETLLIRAGASASRAHSQKRPRLRVVTRQASFVRPAVLASEPAGDDQLRTQFLTARYDWSDPLSAAAFRGWHEQLRDKKDHVPASEDGQYRVETTTADSTLREASIVFEGPDLTPVSLRLLFDGAGWVEITALPEVPEGAVSALPGPGPAKPPAVPESTVTDGQVAARELLVRLAIDSLTNEAVAPVSVDVTGAGSIIVTPYHLPQEQERRLTANLIGKKGVILNPMERGGEPTGDTVPKGDAEPAIGTAGTISSLAHLLDELANRFPPAREALLDPAGRAALENVRRQRTAELIREIDRLGGQLTGTHDIAGGTDSGAAPREFPRSLAGIVDAADSLNRLVTAVYTTGADHIEASIAWPELTREWSRVSGLARQYERHLEAPEEEKR